MTTAAATIAIRPAVARDEPAILRLLTETMAGGPTGERSAAFFRWKHEENPFGRSLALVADVHGDVVGLRMFIRWRFVRRGQPIRAVRAVDTATHPRFQGRGVFTSLTRAALAQAALDADMVFNTPNSKSLPGYLKMGWRPVGRVPIAVRVARPLRFARGLRDTAQSPPAEGRPPVGLPDACEILADRDAVQALLDAADQPHDRIRTDRDAAYLQWRYAQAPGLSYRAIALRDGADLTGIAIGRPRRRGRLAELTLSEVIVRRGDRHAARRLLRAAARCGVDHVATHLTSWPTAHAVRRVAGYIEAPGQGMTLVARTLSEADPGPSTLADWALSLGDLEVF